MANKNLPLFLFPDLTASIALQDPERAAQLNNDFTGFYSPQRSSEPTRPLSNGDMLPGILPGEIPTPVRLDLQTQESRPWCHVLASILTLFYVFSYEYNNRAPNTG